MKLYTKPSELYADLKKDSRLLQSFVGSEVVAKNIIDFSVRRSDDEFSETITREFALAEQARSIAHEIFTNFQKHVKKINFHELTSSQEVTFQSASALVENLEGIIDYVASDPEQFVTNFAKDPKELDKEYFIHKFGAKKDVKVKYSSYDELDYLTNNQRSYSHSLPEGFYIADSKLYRFDSDESSMEHVIQDGQPIVPHLFFAGPKGDDNVIKYIIDQKRGIFGFTQTGVVPILENKFSKIIGNRYAIFFDEDTPSIVVDMYNPRQKTEVPLSAGQEYFITSEEKGKIGDVSIVFQIDPHKSIFLISAGDSVDIRSILSEGYIDFALITSSEEDNFFIVRAKKSFAVYDYYVIYAHGVTRLVATVGKDTKLKNHPHAEYDSDAKKLLITFAPERGFRKSLSKKGEYEHMEIPPEKILLKR